MIGKSTLTRYLPDPDQASKRRIVNPSTRRTNFSAEATVSKILGGIAALGAGIVCGAAVYDVWIVEGLKQEIKIEEIIEDSQDAIAEFNDLQGNWP